MNPHLESSWLIQLYCKLEAAYRASTLQRLLSILGEWIYHSQLYAGWNRFLNKRFMPESIVAFMFLRFLAAKLDARVQRLYDGFMAYKKNSFFCIAFTAIFTEFNSNLFSASAVVVLSFTAGYSLFVTLREIWNPIKLLYVLVLLFLSMILLFLKENVTQWLKNSMAYRFYKYIWE